MKGELTMDDKQKELLNKVIENRAELALDSSLSADERKAAFTDAMSAYDRANKIEEIEASREQAKKNRIIKWVEVGGAILVPIIVLGIKEFCKSKFGDKVMRFEKEDSFTSTPGKSSMSSYFRD
jgi:hypothetical protein